MSSFLDKAKDKTKQIAGQAKDKVDDVKDARKADDLLDDIGRIVYRQRTQGMLANDDARIDAIVAELKALEEAGTSIHNE
ncbi:MAG: hypothetical protein HY826_01935 [Actinobacteria bacterium]|nr:hypothetical protein [Actinomycetota bacterium]